MEPSIYLLILAIAVALFFFCFYRSKNSGTAKGVAHPGTDTVFIGVFVDENNKVGTTTKEEYLHPGQKAIFSSAHKFEIIFNKQSPVQGPSNEGEQIDNLNFSSTEEGVLILKIPKDIFEQERFQNEFRENNRLLFNYEVKVGELTLDPPMHVIPK